MITEEKKTSSRGIPSEKDPSSKSPPGGLSTLHSASVFRGARLLPNVSGAIAESIPPPPQAPHVSRPDGSGFFPPPWLARRPPSQGDCKEDTGGHLRQSLGGKKVGGLSEQGVGCVTADTPGSGRFGVHDEKTEGGSCVCVSVSFASFKRGSLAQLFACRAGPSGGRRWMSSPASKRFLAWRRPTLRLWALVGSRGAAGGVWR